MRFPLTALPCLVLVLASLSGCYESLTDIATADKVVFYEDLLGPYKAALPATGRMTLEKGDRPNAYRYAQYDEKDALTNKGTLWLLKLGEEHFYQLTVDGFTTADGRAVYGVGRLKIEGAKGSKSLTGYAFKAQETLFDDPLIKSVEYEHAEGGERKKSRALSGPAAELQSALLVRAAGMTEVVMKFEQARAGR